MIDFHAHILPATDDGAKDTKTALEMLEKSYNDGIGTVVSTSHCDIRHGSDSISDFLHIRECSYRRLTKAVNADKREFPKIVLASEVHISPGMSKCKNLPSLCIQDTDYILLEMPYDKWNDAVYEEIYHIICMGLKPIIAHLDRYSERQFKDLLSLDVLCQINASAFFDKQSRKMILDLLQNDAAHVIGSDMHNMDTRRPNLAEAFSVIKKKFGSSYSDFFQKNAECILHNGIPRIPHLPELGLIKRMML